VRVNVDLTLKQETREKTATDGQTDGQQTDGQTDRRVESERLEVVFRTRQQTYVTT